MREKIITSSTGAVIQQLYETILKYPMSCKRVYTKFIPHTRNARKFKRTIAQQFALMPVMTSPKALWISAASTLLCKKFQTR